MKFVCYVASLITEVRLRMRATLSDVSEIETGSTFTKLTANYRPGCYILCRVVFTYYTRYVSIYFYAKF